MSEKTKITLLRWPSDDDWLEVKRRALVTVGKSPGTMPPGNQWRRRILEARHSPIRYLTYSFCLEGIPSNTATHLVRHHVGVQPYVSSLRNDRQDKIDGDAARRDTPVDMIIDINAEALMVLANKRLCNKAAPRTREIVQQMCDMVVATEWDVWEGLLVPMCEYHGNICHEIYPCMKYGF